MKLLYCKKCGSIFNISLEAKECECGKTKGKYTDTLNARYCGSNAKPIAIDNRSFHMRLANKKDVKNELMIIDILTNKYINCWFIEKNDCCTTFIKITLKEFNKLK